MAKRITKQPREPFKGRATKKGKAVPLKSPPGRNKKRPPDGRRKGKSQVIQARIDWLSVRRAYVNGMVKEDVRVWPSYRELAVDFGIHLTSIARRASKEKWFEERDHFANELLSKTDEKVIEDLSEQAAQFHIGNFKLAYAQLTEMIEQFKASRLDGRHPTPEMMMVMARTQKWNQSVGRIALGKSVNGDGQGALGGSDYDRIIIDLDAERRQLSAGRTPTGEEGADHLYGEAPVDPE